jgi:thymidylate synthase (FAD)
VTVGSLVAITKRTTVEGAEALLGNEVRVLDHGFVTPLDYMGGDADVIAAARTTSDTAGKGPAEDRALLRYLLRHRHTTPFEMVEVRWLCAMPISVARQWIRHRTANVNEFSQRYSEPPVEAYIPAAEHVAYQSTTNRQGRGQAFGEEHAEEVRAIIAESNARARADRDRLDAHGVALELSRTVLPLGQYTRWVWKIDLHNLMGFLQLRLDPHAQLEIRLFAEAMAGFVRAWVPETWAAFEEYRLGAVTFGATERRVLAAMTGNGSAHSLGWARELAEGEGLKGRELGEFLAKVG